ncbi:MAG TPA: hypothetical protein VMM18_06370 [Gemmatimonadaceae bacterium]|nr:hypothetical protein [Gemmatimonadaceae bacterium]
MRLIACAAPDVGLVSAPISALCELEGAGFWEGFWADESGDYFARYSDGSDTGRWYALVDTPSDTAAPTGPDVLTPVRRGAVPAGTPPSRSHKGALRLRRDPRTQGMILTATVHPRSRRAQ